MPSPDYSRQPGGIYHRRVGGMVLTAINDGYLDLSFEYLVGIAPAESERLQHAAFRRIPPRVSLNAYLIDQGGKLTLVDSGAGSTCGPTAGSLRSHLATLGVAPERIETVLLTHLHIDHVSGLVDEAGGAVFPNADLVMHEREAVFWLGSPPPGAPEELVQAFGIAQRGTAPYRARIRTVTEGEVLPGVTAVPLPGHTPGHTGWRLEDGGERLLIWGDVVHMQGIQFAKPEAALVFDSDTAQAIASRQKILAIAADERLAIAGMHLDFPAFGHIGRGGAGYTFVPETYSPAV